MFDILLCLIMVHISCETQFFKNPPFKTINYCPQFKPEEKIATKKK